MPDRLTRKNPETIHAPAGYSHIVEVQPGRVAYISGQVAFDQAGKLVGDGDIVAQTRQVFENLKAALAALGVGFDSVIKLNYYAVDVSRLAEIREVRSEYLTSPPASTFVVVRGPGVRGAPIRPFVSWAATRASAGGTSSVRRAASCLRGAEWSGLPSRLSGRRSRARTRTA